ncbi:MAG: MEDS domain-containing protein [Gemmatimonadaceae bacterium]
MTDSDELLDISQAAQFLQVSETSLRRWTNSGQLPCLRVGLRRERRFRRGALMEFMEQQPGIHTEATDAHPRGNAVIGGVDTPHGTHLCGIYTSDRARTQLTVGFLAGGLRAGTKSFLVTKPGVRRYLLENLKQERPSLKADIDAGRLTVANFAKSPDAQLVYFQDEFDRALSSGVRSLRVVGDTAGIAAGMSTDELADFESAFSELIAAKYPVVSLCQYDVRIFSGPQILTALRGHPDSLNPNASRWLA